MKVKAKNFAANGVASGASAKSNGVHRAKTRTKTVKAKKKKTARVIDPTKLDRFGFRKGTLKSEAAALYSSRNGATLAQVREKTGSVQFNLIVELEAKGYKIDRTTAESKGRRPATRYHIHAK